MSDIGKRVWEDYEKNWTIPFPDGPQKIFAVSGNSDSSSLESALVIVGWPCNDESLTFSTWKEFAQWHVDNFENINWLFYCPLASECLDDDEHIEMWRKWSKMSAQTLLKAMTNTAKTDPVLFVTESNPLLFWLTKVRSFKQ